MLRSLSIVPLALAACAAPGGPRASLSDGAAAPPLGASLDIESEAEVVEHFVLNTVEVDTRDIYSEAEAEKNFLARTLNATHWTTRVAVVRRECWLRPGRAYTSADVEELERNLRATGLFAAVSARLRPTDVPGVADVIVETKDRLSLSLGASGSFVGDVSSVGTAVSESNLLGMGDRISVSYTENSEDEFRGAFSYRDRHVLGSWVTGNVQVGRTEDGDFAALSVERPFRYLADLWSWQIGGSTTTNVADYFEAGEIVAEVPNERDAFDVFAARRFGPPERSWTVGLRSAHEDITYGAAEGPAAGTITVPGDTTSTLLGVELGHRRIFGFRKVQGLDTIDFVQDLALSMGFTALVGARYRVEDGVGDAVQPTFSLAQRLAFSPANDTYVSLAIDGRARTEEGELEGWSTGLDLSMFELALRPHTLAFRLSYDEAFEGQGLPVQLTLGEDSGLRGYPAREFTGGRIVRINFEDRIDLNARIGSVQFGAVVFADVGWVEDRGQGFGRPLRSAGIGLRLGSDALLGPRVVRIDLSIPLDEVDGQEFDPLVSISLGQVFGFR